MTTTTLPSTHRPSSAPKIAFSPAQLGAALPGALRKLDPRSMWRNPVMFIVEVGAALTTVIAIVQPFVGAAGGSAGTATLAFTWSIAVWLWLTVVFANLAESVAEGRGKAQAASLRQTRSTTLANRVTGYDEGDPDALRSTISPVASSDLRLGDVVVVTAGELIPGDGDVIHGIAT
ncbi:MAG: potassium-transporting ATPase subunit B, partial [Leifsonia sp.]|nr:potassium-transporting ATPase subunit B [Leifsonia sp.]